MCVCVVCVRKTMNYYQKCMDVRIKSQTRNHGNCQTGGLERCRLVGD